MKESFFIISYDIEKDKPRNKVAKILKGYGERVQKSVFEVYLRENRIEPLKKKLSSLIDEETDSIRWYVICENCKGRVYIQGQGVLTFYEDALVI